MVKIGTIVRCYVLIIKQYEYFYQEWLKEFNRFYLNKLLLNIKQVAIDKFRYDV